MTKAKLLQKTKHGAERNATPTSPQPIRRKPASPVKAADRTNAAAGKTRPNSKQASVIAMLNKGASVPTIMKATGWQKHSVHGFFAGIVRKKLGLNLVSEALEGKRIYRIATGQRTKPKQNTSATRAH